MKKILLLILFSFLVIHFVYADDTCDGCLTNGDCIAYGDTYVQFSATFYCDYTTGSLVQQKASGSCVNDFECVEGSRCFMGQCTSAFSDFLSEYYAFKANISSQSYCWESADMFCLNTTQPMNSTWLNKTCSAGYSCYQCNAGYTWNESLGLCITGICSSTPGCLNLTSLNNSDTSNDYCVVGNCFSCDSDYDWNATNNTCDLRVCSSTPGCLNQANLSNGRTLNRACSIGNCFSCLSGYQWDNASYSCVYSMSSVGTPDDWTTIPVSQYDLDVGTERSMRAYDRLQFSFGGLTYYLGVISISSSDSRVNYKIEPVLNNLVALEGVENKFDLNSDGKLDIMVKLTGIESGNAKIQLSAIKEAYQTPETNLTQVANPENNPSPENSTQNNTLFLAVIIGVGVLFFVILVLVIYLVVREPKQSGQPQPRQFVPGNNQYKPLR